MTDFKSAMHRIVAGNHQTWLAAQAAAEAESAGGRAEREARRRR